MRSLAPVCVLISLVTCLQVRGQGPGMRGSLQRTNVVSVVPAGHPGSRISHGPHKAVCAAQSAPAAQAWEVKGWTAYERLWQEFAQDPSNLPIRKFLGLPIGSAADQVVVVKTSRGRSAPNWLNWRPGSYQQIETPHLRIYSRAAAADGQKVAVDLERVFWIWSQVFFPFWDSAGQVALHLDKLSPDALIAEQLAKGTARLSTRKKLRVVLFRDANEYRVTLGQSVPGVEQSTGYYSDERQTSFFYPDSSGDAAATRRHELVHQLFREATRSTLRSEMPGAENEFWLIEGIAGYFESLRLDGVKASLGGWQSSRLQFARYRVLGNRDDTDLSALRSQGFREVQSSADLPRWYAHSIAFTHALFDGAGMNERRFVYQTLADLYKIRLEIPSADVGPPAGRSLVPFLKLDDERLDQGPALKEVTELCLSRCEITTDGLAALPPLSGLTWLDLTGLKVDSSAVMRLCPRSKTLLQLTLELTKVDDGLADWLKGADQLQELDLSWTACGDATVKSIAECKDLTTLWLTGSRVSDASIDTLIDLPSIESIDLQRTGVTPAGIARIKKARPSWNVNPLRLVIQ